MPVEQRLFNAMDKAAISMIEVLENTEQDDAGVAKVSLKERMSTFEMAMNWMSRREKMRPKEADQDGAGVDALRAMLDDPNNVVERMQENPAFQAALTSRGWLAPLPKLTGRPTAEQAQTRKVYQERLTGQFTLTEPPPEDDSKLRQLLEGSPT